MAMTSASVVQVVQDVNRVARKVRAPIHTHLLEYRPYQIQPFCVAPVMAGETLKNLSLQARVITDPLAQGVGNILPWWQDHYYFYVKARQIVKDEFESMTLNGTDLGVTDAANAWSYHVGGNIDWVKRAVIFCVENGGFRNDGELYDVATLDGVPLAAAVRHATNWADSLMADGSVDPANNLQNPHSTDVVLAEYLEAYERMRAMRLIDMTFDDYLETMGVNVKAQDEFDRPELIRVTSDWAYPANTVDPATGMPSGAASFAVSERADKDRFFKEPGFIIGLTVTRPKIFMGNQKSAAVIALDDPYAWMPRTLVDQPHITVKEFVGGSSAPTGPLRGQTNGYWFDVRDLFKYGDQFTNLAAAAGYMPALPAANGEKRFMDGTMINALFADAAKNKVRQDGVTRFSILGHPTTVTDNT
nr:MAG: major capsid protein [Microvirus sp.]